MGRSPCCDEMGVKKGPWTPEEDKKLVEYIQRHGHRSWRSLPTSAGLNRCGKSCRLRWTNYLRPDIKRGKFSEEEDRMIIHLHSILGNKWSTISRGLPGRTDNEIKNYWNTHLKKKLLLMGIDPVTHRRRTDLDGLLASLPNLLAVATNTNLGNLGNPLNNALSLQVDAIRFQVLQTLIQAMTYTAPNIDVMNPLGTGSLRSYQVDDTQLNQLLERLANSFRTLRQDQIPVTPGLSSLANPCQAFSESGVPHGEQEMVAKPNGPSFSTGIKMENCSGITNPVFSSHANIPAVHAQEMVTMDCKQDLTNPPASTQFEGWNGLNLGESDDDMSCWKDIMDQMLWTSEP